MRSFAYHLFYERQIRSELSRNLLQVMVKAQSALSNKLTIPYITQQYLVSEEHVFIKLKLLAEIKAIFKREIISKFFELIMPISALLQKYTVVTLVDIDYSSGCV